ncbi:MAG: FAD-dependent oxidoreductase, partial [Candidatus Thorarchaeota archaeon]
FVCHCGLNIAATVDVVAVNDFAAELPNVTYATDMAFTCSSDGLESIKKSIEKFNLNRVIVASCTPRTHEPIFRETIEEAGLNRFLFEMVNIREHVSWCHMNEKELATEKAKRLIEMAVARARELEPLEMESVEVIPEVAVIGAGVAGISAALNIANGGYKVHLIDRRPTIGGQMALLDKVFPQNDCAICILGPIMASVERKPGINLLTYSEVKDVEGYVGNFTLTVEKKASYVDYDACNGCTECEKVCPVSVVNEYEYGLADRRAIYRPFPQAVPNVYTIDKRGASACQVGCPAGVNGQSFLTLIQTERYAEALKAYRRSNPFAGTLGRVCTSHCEDVCARANLDESVSIRNLHRFAADQGRGKENALFEIPEEKTGKKVAVVGAGPAGIACAYDLVRKGYSVTVFDSKPEAGGLLRWGIPEYRLPRDILSEEIQYVKDHGVTIKTRKKVKSTAELLEQEFYAIFLGIGASDSSKLRIEGENLDGVFYAVDFLDDINSGKTPVIGDKVAVIGGGNAAIDAARVAKRLGAKNVTIVYRRSRLEMPAIPSEVDEAEVEGIKIRFLSSPTSVVGDEGKVKEIHCIEMYLGEPDASGRRRPIPKPGSDFKIGVDSVIVAIGQTVKSTGIVSELELTEWGTVHVNPVTLQTSLPHVFAGGDVVTGPSTVVEAVAAGKEAAISIDRFLMEQNLAEGRDIVIEPIPIDEIDTRYATVRRRAKMPTLSKAKRKESFEEVELGFKDSEAIAEASRCLGCSVCCECELCVDVCERDAIDHSMEPEIVTLNVGTIVLATGAESYEPYETREYGYGMFPNVITNAQFERLTNAAGPTAGKLKRISDGEKPKSIAFLQCVGSRDARFNRDFCCYVGCENSLKQATQIKEKYPEIDVTIFAMDVRTHGTGYEALYLRAREMGVVIVKSRASEIEEQYPSRDLQIYAEDLYTGMNLGLTFDMAVLATGLHPHDDTPEITRTFGLNTDQYGFYMCAHPKLKPVESFKDGIFLAGACLGPMDIAKAVAQGEAAAAKAQAIIAPGRFNIEPIYAEIDTDKCIKCELCADVCPYGAPTLVEETMIIAKELCQGCGTCAAGCPSLAIDMKHF